MTGQQHFGHTCPGALVISAAFRLCALRRRTAGKERQLASHRRTGWESRQPLDRSGVHDVALRQPLTFIFDLLGTIGVNSTRLQRVQTRPQEYAVIPMLPNGLGMRVYSAPHVAQVSVLVASTSVSIIAAKWSGTAPGRQRLLRG